MRKESGQWSVVSGQKSKFTTCNLKLATLILLFAVHCALFTVVTGCGKKAPPKPPQETVPVR